MTKSERLDLRGDGRIIIWARGKKGIYQARIKVPNSKGFALRSTNTSNKNEAIAVATNLYDEFYFSIKQGGSLKTGPAYRDVWKEWDQYEPRKKITGDVLRYSVPYFDKTPIADITPAKMSDFWLWRQANGKKKNPASSTLKREMTYITGLFRFAVGRGYLKSIPNLNPLQITDDGKRRSTFTAKEWQTILDSMESWVNQKGIATSRDRQLAADNFRILANTGIRVGEARSLKWADIRRDGNYTILTVSGKTGTRECVGLAGTDAAFDRVRRLTDKHDLVFCHPDGRPIQSFKKSWSAVLKHAGVEQRDRSIYSLRHYFATQRLMNGVSVYILSKQMGTSVEMIEKFYGHLLHSDVAEQIVQDRLRQELGADLTAFIEDD